VPIRAMCYQHTVTVELIDFTFVAG
jgi:hypothetical protein